MPLTMQLIQTPAGHKCLRTESYGDVTAADAQKVNEGVAPGAPYFHLPILAVVQSGANYSPEARQAFGGTKSDGKTQPRPVAIVVTNAPLRVMLSFVLRISGTNNTKFVGTEADGLAWLDEQIALGK